MSLDWRRHRHLIQIGAVLAIAALTWGLAQLMSGPLPAPPEPAPSVVTVATVHASRVPIIRRGIGQVQAFNTDAIKSRVDGNIMVVAYREGQHVRQGDLLVQIDPRPFQIALAQARAAIDRDSVQLTNALRDLARDTALVKPGLVTPQAYDAQGTLVKQLRATVELDRAQADQARLDLEYAAIRAPFNGRTGVRLVDVGNLVHATDQNPLVILTQMQPIFVSFTLPERYLDEVRGAMRRGPVDVLAFDRDDEHAIARGQLTVIDNTVDPASGMVRLKAQYANEDEALWPGEFVNAHVIIAISEQGITVPTFALQQGPNGRFVFRVTPQGTAQMVPVQVAQIEGSDALIEQGLQPGERIVVDGAYGLTDGAPVAVRQPGGLSPGHLAPPVPQSTAGRGRLE